MTVSAPAINQPITRKLSFSDAQKMAEQVVALKKGKGKRGSVPKLVERFNMNKEQHEAMKLVARFPRGTVTQNFERVLLRQGTLLETGQCGSKTVTTRVAYLLSDYLVVAEHAGSDLKVETVLALATATAEGDTKNKYTISVKHAKGTFSFQAVSPKDRQQWLSLMGWAINDSIQRARAIEMMAQGAGGPGLFTAVKECNPDLLQHLLIQKADTNHRNSEGLTALHCAVVSGSAAMVEVMASKGCRMDVPDAKNRTPMELATLTPAVPPVVVLALVDGGACVKSGLYHAATNKHAIVMTTLLSTGVSLNVSGDEPEGKSILHHACQSDCKDTAAALINHGAYPNNRDDQNNTPLHHITDPILAEYMMASGARKDFLSKSQRKLANVSKLRNREAGVVKGDDTVCQVSEWVPDDSSDTCLLCSKVFWFFCRRHHCRRCGVLVCDDCSESRFTSDGDKVRACDSCYNVLSYKSEQKSEQKSDNNSENSEVNSEAKADLETASKTITGASISTSNWVTSKEVVKVPAEMPVPRTSEAA